MLKRRNYRRIKKDLNLRVFCWHFHENPSAFTTLPKKVQQVKNNIFLCRDNARVPWRVFKGVYKIWGTDERADQSNDSRPFLQSPTMDYGSFRVLVGKVEKLMPFFTYRLHRTILPNTIRVRFSFHTEDR